MQNITESEFQREVQALKSHRRISVNRPLLDPDLPDLAAAHGGGRELLGSEDGSSSSSSPSSSPHNSPSRGIDLSDHGPTNRSASSSSSPEAGSSSGGRQAFTARRRGAGALAAAGASASPSGESDGAASAATSSDDTPLTRPLDPSHLFWVPASVHPEISPNDFRKFLQDHASRAAKGEGADGLSSASTVDPASPGSPPPSPVDALVHRSTSIARRGSTLRRQYQPEHEDDGGSSSSSGGSGMNTPTLPGLSIPGTPRSGASLRKVGSRGSNFASSRGEPTLSIDDLQKLEKLAEDASRSNDPAELRSVLRRTMSLNVAPSALDQVDAVPAEAGVEDAPLIVPRPGQILRRAARTKIRKASLGESSGAGNRAAGLRRRGAASPSFGQRQRDHQSQSSGDLTLDKDTMEMAGVAMALSDQRRQSDLSSDLSSGEDEAGTEASKRASEGATESIVDAYSRDSYISDGTQRTSVTSVTDSISSSNDTMEERRGEDHSPPETPTPQTIGASQRGGGYFDVVRDTKPSESNDSERASPLYESPAQSPTEAFEYSSSSQRPIRPIPVQQVPPVPSFEKKRPTPAAQSPPPASSAPPSLAQTRDAGPPGHGLVKADTMPIMPSATSKPIVTAQKEQQPSTRRAVSPPLPQPSRHGKEKKSSFGLSWFGLGKEDDDEKESGGVKSKLSKREKKERKEKEREAEQFHHTSAQQQQTHNVPSASSFSGAMAIAPDKDKDKDKDSSGFLGSLFGKKKGHEEAQHGSKAETGPYGQITAGSLLDRGMGKGPYVNYYRYPIHIERAVYRLSHIKLANPRRPLYEQVLISNLMFWYLSIINRSQQQQQQLQQQQQQQLQQATAQQPQQQQQAQQQQQTQQQQQQQQLQASSSQTAQQEAAGGQVKALAAAQDHQEHEDPEFSETITGQQLPDMGAVTEPSVSTSAAAAPSKVQQPQKTKRGGLTKPNRAPPGSRSAETAIPAAGYGAQHRQLNDEFSHVGGSGNVSNYGGDHGSNGMIGGGPSISVGQVVDPRALQAYGGGAGVNRGPSTSAYMDYSTGESYDESSGGLSDVAAGGTRRVSPQPTVQRVVSGGGGSSTSRRGAGTDEHAWLGSGGSARIGPGRRSPSAEDRRSDPSADIWKAEGGVSAIEGWTKQSAASRKPYRSSDPQQSTNKPVNGEEVEGRYSFEPEAFEGGATRSKARAKDGAMSTSSSGKSLSSTLSSGSGGSNSDGQAPAHNNDAEFIPIVGSGSSAMLDAARTSQSRRR